MPTITEQTLSKVRLAAEASHFYFTRAILGYSFLTEDLHLSMSRFISDPTSYRNMMLVPRDFAKTTMMKSLALHALIQPKDNNRYFPGMSGTDTRMIIGGETTKNASRHLRSIESTIESNTLIKLLWPHIKPGNKWSETEMELQRESAYSEPTIEALGTDTAIASRHVDWIFEDDIFTFEAAMSPSVAERVRLWDKALEPILDSTENHQARNTITGTPWSHLDPYKERIDDTLRANQAGEIPEYAMYIRSAIENQQSIWPSRFPLSRLKRIEQRLRGTPFWQLNYMCSYTGSGMQDLKPETLLRYTIDASGAIKVNGEAVCNLNDCFIYTIYDPARSRESEYKHLARNAIMTCACSPTYDVFVLDYYVGRDEFNTIYNALERQTNTFNSTRLGVEDVAVQISIGDAFNRIAQLQNHRLPPMESLRPDTRINKKFRIKSTLQQMQNRIYCLAHHYDLISEWEGFPNSRTIDLLDVLAYFVIMADIPDMTGYNEYNKKLKDRIAESRGSVVLIDDYRPYDSLDAANDPRYFVPQMPANIGQLRRYA